MVVVMQSRPLIGLLVTVPEGSRWAARPLTDMSHYQWNGENIYDGGALPAFAPMNGSPSNDAVEPGLFHRVVPSFVFLNDYFSFIFFLNFFFFYHQPK